MIRKWIKRAGERIEDRLRRVCGAISPDKRVIAIITLFVLFAALSLYSTVSAIYSLACTAAGAEAQAGILRKFRSKAAAGSSLSR